MNIRRWGMRGKAREEREEKRWTRERKLEKTTTIKHE